MSLSADLILRGGRIYTGNPSAPRAEALAALNGRIVAVGEKQEINELLGPSTQVEDYDNALILPAFSDCHTHFTLGSLGLEEIDLKTVSGKDEFRSEVMKAASRLSKGQWISGGYWNDEHWGGESPDITWIEDIAPDNPTLLMRHDIHQALCNSRALEIAGFTGDCPDPPGGEIGRFENGQPNGLVYERAMTLVYQQVPPPDFERRRAALLKGMKLANSHGITAVSDMIDGPSDIDFYFRMAASGELTCRIELLMPLPLRESLINAGLKTGIRKGLVTLGPMKGFMDGSLGSRTAHMFQPYDDEPDNSGYPLEMADPPEKIFNMMKEAADAGFCCAVHAIGDKANGILLDLFDKLRKTEKTKHLRHRVEHAQHLTDDQVPRFSELDLLVSMQPTHLIDDGCYAEEALGKERVRTSYRFKSLINCGARVMFNTDWPVVDINPLIGIQAAVTRQTSDGKKPNGWIPGEKISVNDAVHAYTSVPAYARNEDDILGELSTGYEADFIVLDTDIFNCPAEEIAATRVLATYLRGRKVYPEVTP